MRIEDFVDIDRTICKDLFEGVSCYWEVIPKIGQYIINIGNFLDKREYTEIEKNIWIGRNVVIDKLAVIVAPCIIDADTVIRPGAYLRGNVIIGKRCVIGNSVEIKNSVIFDDCKISHFNYVGDSILGYHINIGAGVILSNLKNDGSNITIFDKDKLFETNLKKIGSLIGDCVNIGCNSVVFPGSVIGRNTNIYPLVKVRGTIKENSIMKSDCIVVEKEN